MRLYSWAETEVITSTSTSDKTKADLNFSQNLTPISGIHPPNTRVINHLFQPRGFHSSRSVLLIDYKANDVFPPLRQFDLSCISDGTFPACNIYSESETDGFFWGGGVIERCKVKKEGLENLTTHGAYKTQK